jgi:hypothetical protein
MVSRHQASAELNKRISMTSQLTNRSKSLSQIDWPLTWQERCNQVESQLIIPLTNKLQQQLGDLYSLMRILQYARQRGHRPTLTDTVADLRDPSMKRADFRALARRVQDLLDDPACGQAKGQDTPAAVPATTGPTTPITRPPCRPIPASPEPAKLLPVPAHPMPTTTPPTPAQLPPVPRPQTDLARLLRMMGNPDQGQPSAPTPQ